MNPARFTPRSDHRLLALLEGAKQPTASDVAYLLDIAREAYHVRGCQRAYFKNPADRNLLEASKAGERALDRLLTEPAQGALDL